MGEVITKITLENVSDLSLLDKGFIQKMDVHTLTLDMKADTGAITELVIDEATRARLALGIIGTKTAVAVGGTFVECKITAPVNVHWKNRFVVCNALVVLRQKQALLGVIAMEKLDVKVNPVSRELEGIHGAETLAMLD